MSFDNAVRVLRKEAVKATQELAGAIATDKESELFIESLFVESRTAYIAELLAAARHLSGRR